MSFFETTPVRCLPVIETTPKYSGISRDLELTSETGGKDFKPLLKVSLIHGVGRHV
jgi:hypothetical protein